MCKPASMIVLKNKVLWGKLSESHEDIIAEHKISMDGARGPNGVRVEISPPNDDFAAPLEQWVFLVDQDVLPPWWDAEAAERRVRAELPAWVAAKVAVSGEATVNVGVFFATGSARVTAYDSAQVAATGSAQVTAYDSAQVTATGSARVTAYSSAQVTATGSAQVTAYDSAQVTATGSARVTAYDSAQVAATGSAQVTATDSAQVTATGSARVTATGSATVMAWSAAAVIRIMGCLCAAVFRVDGQLRMHVGTDVERTVTSKEG